MELMMDERQMGIDGDGQEALMAMDGRPRDRLELMKEVRATAMGLMIEKEETRQIGIEDREEDELMDKRTYGEAGLQNSTERETRQRQRQRT